jgi:hypothetical protein
MIATVYGAKARFCGSACRDGFRCDRQHRLIYPSYLVDGTLMGVEPASIAAGFCAYCSAADVPELKPATPTEEN